MSIFLPLIRLTDITDCWLLESGLTSSKLHKLPMPILFLLVRLTNFIITILPVAQLPKSCRTRRPMLIKVFIEPRPYDTSF